MSATAAAPPSDHRAFFGHPRGLAYLAATEALWSFAYYGLVTLLTLYMTRELFTPGHIEHVVGFSAYRALLERIFGPMTTLALASQTFGLVTGFVYATPIVGGLLSDNWLGQRRGVTFGLAVMVAGHLLLVTEAGFLAALLLIVLGAGFVKSNMVAQIGRLYGPDDSRRTRGFGLFLIAVNVGGFATPLVCGTLGEKLGFRYGLAAAAIAMLAGLLVYIAGLRHMPPDALRRSGERGAHPPALRRGDGKILVALLLLFVAEVLNVGAYNQAFNIFPVWASAHVDLDVAGFRVPVTWFSGLDGVLTIVGTALAVRLWTWQSSRGREPGDISRVAIGCTLTAIAFVILGVASAAAGGGKAPFAAGVGFFLFADFALPWVDTVIMSLISRAAPPALTTTMMSVYYLSFAVGNFVVGWLGSLYERMSPPVFWLTHAALVGAGVAYVLAIGPWLKATLAPRATGEPDASTADPLFAAEAS